MPGDMNSSSSNDTSNSTTPLSSSVNPAAVFTSVIFAGSVLVNVLVLYLYSRVTDLSKKPFHVFMLNLIITDLLYCLWENSFDVGIGFLPDYWQNRSDVICTVYLYCNYTLQSASCNAHMLITFNRLWAIIFPVSYKSNQKIQTFILICAVEWCYVHVIALPGLISDDLYYRLDIRTNGCLANSAKQPAWTMVVSLLLYVLPLSVVILAYPFILYKHHKRTSERRRLRPEAKSTKATTVTPKQEYTDPEGETTTGTAKNANARSSGQPMLILTLLTFSATVCWTPNVVVYTVYTFIPLPDDMTIFTIVTCLYSVQLLMDPILFIVALAELRTAFFQVLHSLQQSSMLRWFRGLCSRS